MVSPSEAGQSRAAGRVPAVHLDRDLVARYDTAGPRYTSYPTAAEFHSGVGSEDLAGRLARAGAPLSLYVHIPFCATVCYYCACNKVITANRRRAQDYLPRLEAEIGRLAARCGPDRVVEQLHWGGGTPTYLDDGQIRRLMKALGGHFQLADTGRGEFGIEVDPRTLGPETLAVLREVGFNRLSMGVQDLDPRVQKAVNRIQPPELTEGAIGEARRLGFRSVSLDLIYGLPLQTVAGFEATLAEIIRMRPDRLSLFNYAHLPQRFKVQRQIHAEDLPSPEDKLTILARSIEMLQEAGYLYIGMDHFALADDDLARALADGSLQRNFQGYSTHARCDLVGLGASSISMLEDCYAQNAHAVDDYQARIDEGGLATVRGVVLNADDRLRRQVIMDLMCRFAVDFEGVGADHGVEFGEYFATELERLGPMADDGLVEVDGRGIRVTPAGRLLIRNIAMVFDAYRQGAPVQGFSKVI